MSPGRDTLATSRSDRVWRAIADSIRRALLDELAKGPRTTGDLVERCPQLYRTAVMKRLDTLEAAGLVFVRREDRVRWHHINATRFRTSTTVGFPSMFAESLALRAGSKLRITDAIVGHVKEDSIACLESGWMQLFRDGLKPHAESRA